MYNSKEDYLRFIGYVLSWDDKIKQLEYTNKIYNTVKLDSKLNIYDRLELLVSIKRIKSDIVCQRTQL